MSVPRFFERAHAAVGNHLPVDAQTLGKKLEERVVGVHCGGTGRNPAWISELLVNQLARLYPRLCVFGDDSQATSLAAVARGINPGIDLVADPAQASLVVSTSDDAPAGALVASADGWFATCGTTTLPGSSENPFAAGVAAAFAAGAVFRRLLLDDQNAWTPSALDLLALSPERPPSSPMLDTSDVGSLLVAGAGAVGNAALWALARHPSLRGTAIVVDPERVELSNLQRYVLTSDTDVGAQKTELARRTFAGSSLQIDGRVARVGEVDLEAAENVLVTVDNIAARRIAQALLPRLVVNGWTSDSGLGASWHDFAEDRACLACLYQPSGAGPSQTDLVADALGLPRDRTAILWITAERLNRTDVEQMAAKLSAAPGELKSWIGKELRDAYSKLICGSAAIAIGERGRIETVPLAHQSVMAGILAAADLVKRTDARLRGTLPEKCLVAWHDVTRAPPAVWLQQRGPEQGCFCRDADYREVFREKWPAQ